MSEHADTSSSEWGIATPDVDEVERRLNGLIEAGRALAAAVERFTSLVKKIS